MFKRMLITPKRFDTKSVTAGLWAGILITCFGGTVAHADLITSSAQLTDPTTLTFSPFVGENRVDGVGPVQVGTEVGEDVLFTSSSSDSFVGETRGTYFFGADSGNGLWDGSFGPFTASNAEVAQMTYTFGNPVNGVGGFMNYSPVDNAAVYIEALNSSFDVLESFDLTTDPDAAISTPGATNGGAFRGILRSSNDISAFRVSNRFVALGDLSFSRAAETIPAPATIGLLALGLFSLRLRLKA